MLEKFLDSSYEIICVLSKHIKVINEVNELPIKHSKAFEALNIVQQKGVLVNGPPGTRKTLLVLAIAHHAGCVCVLELVQKFIREWVRMVREMFVMAGEHTPSIIFMDEINSMGPSQPIKGGSRGDSSGAHNAEAAQGAR